MARTTGKKAALELRQTTTELYNVIKDGHVEHVRPLLDKAREQLDKVERDVQLPISADFIVSGLGPRPYTVVLDLVDSVGETIRELGDPGYGFGQGAGPDWLDNSTAVYHASFGATETMTARQALEETRAKVETEVGYQDLEVVIK